MQFEFGNAGIIGTGQSTKSLPRALRMSGVLAESLVEASKEYAFVMPYLVPRLMPGMPFEPLAEACKETGYPTQHWYWLLPEPAFHIDQVGRSMGLVGNALHGFPIREWPAVHNFLKSLAFYDSSKPGQVAAAIAIQKLRLLDPFYRKAATPAEIYVYTLTVATPTGTVCWVPDRVVGDFVYSYRPQFSRSVHAESVGTLVDALLLGDTNPLDTVEAKHGFREIRLPDKLEDKSVIGGKGGDGQE